ncbi:MAG TPA: hypothetical protein VG738_11655 [Chitinophagaceae bacterium]|nr:hypothetical protein [Chitinophagaceae bacterium]
MENEQKINNDDISLDDAIAKIGGIFRYLFSKWLIILMLGFAGGVAGILYAWVQTPQYKAVLTFSMEDDKSSSGSIAGLAAQFGLDLGSSGAFSGENIVALLQSNKITKATLLTAVNVNGKKESLLNLYCDVFEVTKGFAKSPEKELRELRYPENQDPSTYSRMQDSVLLLIIGAVQKNVVKIDKPDPKYNLYAITCLSPDETFSFEYCRELIKQASDYYIETKTKRSAQIVDILQKRSDSLRNAYNSALTGKAELSDANLNLAMQLPAVGIQSKQTDLTVFAAAYGELLKNLELAKFNLLKETPVIQVLDEPMEPLLKVKLGRLLAGIIGAFFFGFICVLILIFRKLFIKPRS